jgi:hypothetical protein
MEFQEVGCGGMDCIDLAQDGDRCRELVNRDSSSSRGVTVSRRSV